MEQAEALLREWCERHPGWFHQITMRIGPYGWEEYTLQLRCGRQKFSILCIVRPEEAERSSLDLRKYELGKVVYRICKHAEDWICDNTNDGGGCTPTRVAP